MAEVVFAPNRPGKEVVALMGERGPPPLTPGLRDRYRRGVPRFVVFQVINHDREETFFGVTDRPLDDEIGTLARDPNGPAGGWKKGETVEWRPLTGLLEWEGARMLHRRLERSKGRGFRLIPTFKPTASGTNTDA